MLKTIEEQVKSGADLTWQLLSFARGGKFEAKPADLNAIVQEDFHPVWADQKGDPRSTVVFNRTFGRWKSTGDRSNRSS